MQMRVRVSLLKAGFAVGENGSALNVTDSRAMARVLVAWLSRIGFLFVAAATVLPIKTQTKKAKKNL
jgi:phage gp16-like protein